MKFFDYLRIMRFLVKLIAESENDKIKIIEEEQNNKKNAFIVKNHSIFQFF